MWEGGLQSVNFHRIFSFSIMAFRYNPVFKFVHIVRYQLLRKLKRKQFLLRFCKSIPGLSIRYFPSHRRCFPRSCRKSFLTCREIFPRVAEKYLLPFGEKYWCLLGEKYLSACPPPSPRPLAAFLPHSASLYYQSSSILRQAPRSDQNLLSLTFHLQKKLQDYMHTAQLDIKTYPFVLF